MPVFDVELEDGRILEIESDHEPNESEVVSALASYQPEKSPTPEESAPWIFGRQKPKPSLEPSLPILTPEFMKEGMNAAVETPQGWVPGFQPTPSSIVPMESPETAIPSFQQQESMRQVPMQTAIGAPKVPTSSSLDWWGSPEVRRQESWEQYITPAAELPTAPAVEDSGVTPKEELAMWTPSVGSPLLRLALGKDVTATIYREAYNLVKSFPEFFTSPMGITTAGLGGIPSRVVPTAVKLGFAADMISKALQMDEDLQRNWNTMTSPQRTAAIVHLLGTGALGASLAKSAASPALLSTEIKLKENYAKSLRAKAQASGRPAQGVVESTQEQIRLWRAEENRLATESQEVAEFLKVDGQRPKFQVLPTASQAILKNAPEVTSPFTVNPKTRRVVIIKDRLTQWMEDVRATGRDPANAVRSAIAEEIIHLKGTREEWLKFYQTLSWAEKQIGFSRYNLGEKIGVPSNVNQVHLGAEIMRFRLQRAISMEPTEFAMMAGKELWTWKSLTALEEFVVRVRSLTKSGTEQSRMMERALGNIQAAKSVVPQTQKEETEGGGKRGLQEKEEKVTPEGAVTAPQASLPLSKAVSLSKSLEDSGASKEEIYQNTGLWKIPGGDWIRDIPKIEITEARVEEIWNDILHRQTPWMGYPLESLIGVDNQLFKEHPELRAMNVEVDLLSKSGGGSFSEPIIIHPASKKLGHVKISMPVFLVPKPNVEGQFRLMFPRENKGVPFGEGKYTSHPVSETLTRILQHEVNHAVQWKLNLPEGGSPLHYFLDKDIKFDAEKMAKEGGDYYRRLAGEALSRLTERRASLSPEQMDVERPWETFEKMLIEEGIIKPGESIEDALVVKRKGKVIPRSTPTAPVTGAQPDQPFAPSRRQRFARDWQKLQELRIAAEEGRAGPAAEEMQKLHEAAYPPVTPQKASDFVTEYVRTKVSSFGKNRVTRKVGEGEYEMRKPEGISFEDFCSEFRLKFGKVPNSQLRDVFLENMGSELVNLARTDPARLADIAKQLKVTKKVVGGGKPGERTMTNLPKAQLGLFGETELTETTPLGFTIQKSVGGLRRAESSAGKAKLKEGAYDNLMEDALALHREIYRSGYQDVTDNGKLIKRPLSRRYGEIRKTPAEIQHIVEQLVAIRRRMDRMVLPTPAPEIKTGVREAARLEGQTPGLKVLEEYTQKVEPPFPKPAFQPGTPNAVTQAAKRHRITIRTVQEIFDKLLEETEQRRGDIARSEVTPEEIGNQKNSKEPVYYTISADELSNPTSLGERMTEDSGVKGNTQTVTHRLAVLLDKRTGSVQMVSMYRTGGESGEVKVTSPYGAKSDQSFASTLKTHRPIYSIYLEDPVQNFRKRFNSLSEYNREFGSDAQWLSSGYETVPIEGGAETGLTSSPTTTGQRAIPGEFIQGQGLIRPSGSVIGPSADIARAQMDIGPREVGSLGELQQPDVRAALQYIGDMTGPESLGHTLERLRADVAGKRPVEWPLREISGLARMVANVMRRDDEMSPGQAVRHVAQKLYELKQYSPDPETAAARAFQYFGGEFTEPAGAGPITATEPLRRGASSKERARWIAAADRLAEHLKLKEKEGTAGVSRELTMPAPGEPIGRGQLARPKIYSEALSPALEDAISSGNESTAASRSRAIRVARNYIRTPNEDARFTKLIKDLGAIQREVDAEIASELSGSEAQMETGPFAPTRRTNLQNQQAGIRARLTGAFLKRGGSNFADWYSGWMTQNIRDAGGAYSKMAADAFEQINSYKKQLKGDWDKTVGDQAKVASAGTKEFWLVQQMPTPKMVAASRWLGKLEEPWGKGYAVARVRQALEGTINVPQWIMEVIGPDRDANLATGRLLEPVTENFVASNKMENIWTGQGYDFFMHARGPIWDGYLRAMARANPDPATGRPNVGAVRQAYQKLRAEMSKELPDINSVETIRQDIARTYPNQITHVKLPKPFGWMPILHTNLFSYLESSAQRATWVRAFRERFPNTPDGRKQLSALNQRVRMELSDQPNRLEDWDAIIRVAQGHPTDTYNWKGPAAWVAPGTFAGEALRALDQTVVAVIRRLVLTGQMVTQVPETVVGPTSQFFGIKNNLIALKRMKAIVPTMEVTGKINKMLYDFSWDPANPVRSTARWVSNAISKVFFEHFLNELQGKWFGANAIVASERFAAGDMTVRERGLFRETLLNMGFKKLDVNELMRAQASGQLGPDHAQFLETFHRRAPSWGSGENKTMMEGSRLAGNRLFNSIFRFQMYPMLKMNQLTAVARRWVDAENSGTKLEKRAARERMATFLFGTTLQGAGLVLLSALARGRGEGAAQKWEEAKDDPLSFLTESFLGAMSGPMYLVWSGAKYGGVAGVGEQATRLAFPFSVLSDLTMAASRQGRYKDLSFWEATGKFLDEKTPGYRQMKAILGVWGTAQDKEYFDLQADLRALSEWKRDHFGWTRSEYRKENDPNSEFRKVMKRAWKAYSDEDDPAKYRELLKEAYQVKGDTEKDPAKRWESIRRSISSHQVLEYSNRPLTNEERAALIDRIGDQAFDRLKAWDLMVERAADGL